MELQTLWKLVLAELELSLSKAIYQTHFAKTKLLALSGGVATIGVPNQIVRGFIESRYYSLVKKVIDEHTKENVSLTFAISQETKPLTPADAGPLFTQQLTETQVSLSSVAKRLHILPSLTFDNFAVSSTNQIAYAAATAVAKNLGSAYNPLFFYGGVGVGKTHLMHAVANTLLEKKHTARIVYCMGEEFLNEIVEAIQTKTVRLFKQKYRGAHLLLVDDVQFIAGKQTAQEEFFHTFNAVHREGGQIILTSDRPPSEISRLEERLRSRFEGGLLVDIAPPDFELRMAIVNIKAESLGISITPEISQLIAANITNSRAMEGFLRRIMTELSAKKSNLSPAMVSSLLSGKEHSDGQKALQTMTKRMTGTDVLEAAAAFFDLKTTTLKGPKRDRPIARPRQLIMYLCKTELGLTLEDIGGLLGGRDHTTIMHGVETITQELSTNEKLREDILGIKERLKRGVI